MAYTRVRHERFGTAIILAYRHLQDTEHAFLLFDEDEKEDRAGWYDIDNLRVIAYS